MRVTQIYASNSNIVPLYLKTTCFYRQEALTDVLPLEEKKHFDSTDTRLFTTNEAASNWHAKKLIATVKEKNPKGFQNSV